MPVIVKGYGIFFFVITIDPGECYYWPPKVSANVFGDSLGIGKIRFGIDIETIFLVFIRQGFIFFELRFLDRISNPFFHEVKQSCSESLTHEGVVEVMYITPESIVTDTTFREKTVDVRIPLKGSAECMKDQDISGSEIYALVHLVEHALNHATCSIKETV